MVEPGPHDRLCRFGDKCEGFNLQNGFALREFLLPGQEVTAERRPCILCYRKMISTAFYTSLANSPNDLGTQHVPLSPFYNLVGIPGEYTLDDMLCAAGLQSSALPLPCVKHMRSAYDVVRQNGVRRVQQTLYRMPEESGQPAFFRRGVSRNNSAT